MPSPEEAERSPAWAAWRWSRAALAGVHGGEAKGSAGARDLGDGCGDGGKELGFAGGLEAGGVEVNLVVLLGGEAEELGGEVLERVEEFGVALEQEPDVGAGEDHVENGLLAGLFVIGGCFCEGTGDGKVKGQTGGQDVLSQELLDAINR